MNPTVHINPNISKYSTFVGALPEDLRLNVGADARAIDGRPDDIGNLVPLGAPVS